MLLFALLFACPESDPELENCLVSCEQTWSDCQEGCLDLMCQETCDSALLTCTDVCYDQRDE